MKKIIPTLLLTVIATVAYGQRFVLDKSTVSFYSSAPVEDIEAHNEEGNSIIDLETGDMVFSIPIRGFQFEKALMQEHFNENYLESHKFPNATFSAVAFDWERFNGEQEIQVGGDFNIHGVANRMEITGKMLIEKKRVVIDAEFDVAIAKHDIKVPKALFYNIAEVIQVKVHLEYKPFEK